MNPWPVVLRGHNQVKQKKSQLYLDIGCICFKENLVKNKEGSHSRSLDLHLVFISYANEGLAE